jgi:tetrahydromethanopterin S-methyltransferase subunit E
MRIHPTLKRLLEAAILSALAGGIAYGLTARLAPPSVSAFLVAIIVAVITALAVAVPATMIRAVGRKSGSAWSTPDTYYEMGFSVHKDEGWND